MERLQTLKKSFVYAVEKARYRSEQVGTVGPPAADALGEDLLLDTAADHVRGATCSQHRAMTWDTGATRGMTQMDAAVGMGLGTHAENCYREWHCHEQLVDQRSATTWHFEAYRHGKDH